MNLGVDVGGRHIGMAFVKEDGTIMNKEVIELTEKNKSVDTIFRIIQQYVDKYENRIDSIGIGIPGLCRENHIEYACNLGLKDIDVRQYLKTRKPVYLANDALCATIAEYHYIDNKMYSDYILITIGTGVGAGIILNGQIYTGSTGAAGEVGHMTIEKDGCCCNCGRRGCYEKYASVSALLKRTGVDSLKEVFYLVERNEKISKVFDEYLEYVSEGLANIINLYDAEILVIGGSLAWFGDKYMHKLKTKVSEKLFNQYNYDLNMKCAKLGNDAGIIGAALLEEYL